MKWSGGIITVLLVTGVQHVYPMTILPLHEDPKLYEQLGLHNRNMLPSLNKQFASIQQEFKDWMQDHLSSENYRAFIAGNLTEKLLKAQRKVVEAILTSQYAQRSLQLMEKCEGKIKQLQRTIEQLQAQEPLRVSYEPSSDVSMGPLLPEEILTKPKKQPMPVSQDEEEPELYQRTQESEEKQAEEETENAQEKTEPPVTAKKLKDIPKEKSAVIMAEQKQLQAELKQGLEQEKEGTAQPGWRDLIMQKWQQLKQNAKDWWTGEKPEQENAE